MIHFVENTIIYSEPQRAGVNFLKAVLFLNNEAINENAPLVAFLNNGLYTFDLSGVLSSAGLFDNTPPDMPTQLSIQEVFSLKSITIKTAPINSDILTGTTTLLVQNGKIPDALFDKYGQAYSENLQNQWLTFRKLHEIVKYNQPLFLSFFSNWSGIPTDLSIAVKFGGKGWDSEIYIVAELKDIALNRAYTLSCLIQNLIDIYDGYKEIEYVDLLITGNETTLLYKRLYIDYENHIDESILVYLNHLGAWEVLRMVGEKKQDINTTYDSVVIKNRYIDVNSEYRQKISMPLGTINSHHAMDIIKDLSHSNHIYLYQNNQLIRLNKSFDSVTAYQSSAQYDNPTLEFNLTYLS